MLELSEVVRNLREELQTAKISAGEDELKFEVSDITLELSVTVSREGTAGTRVRFYVVDVGAEGKIAQSSIQKITLTLNPVEGNGHVQISGRAAPGEGVGPKGVNDSDGDSTHVTGA